MSDTPTEDRFEDLAPFVTNPASTVYCLKDLPEEVMAVLFAYVSRSPNSLRANLRSLLGEEGLLAAGRGGAGFDPASEKARRFHEKWVVGYGHASVAEHAVLHYGIEDLSILLTKVIEDNRLASYTEKSTRYQYFGRDTVYLDPELAASALGPACRAGLDALMDAYRACFAAVDAHLRARVPCPPAVKPAAYEAALHAQVCDAARALLPLATRTMLALTINARSAAWAICKLLSHPLPEARALGARMRDEGRTICPTLLKHADEVPFLSEARGLAADAAWVAGTQAPRANGVRLLDATPDGLDRLLAAWLYEASGRDLEGLRAQVAAWPDAHKRDLLDRLATAMGPHDVPPRAFEALRYTLEVTLDYGAFRDIQRHRIGSQWSPPLTPDLGYEIPDDVIEAGQEAPFRAACDAAAELHARVVPVFPEQAAYLLPLAYRKRVLLDWDLREIAHFVPLRASPQGHISYRRIAWAMRDAVVGVHPFAAPFLPADRNLYPLGRLGKYAC